MYDSKGRAERQTCFICRQGRQVPHMQGLSNQWTDTYRWSEGIHQWLQIPYPLGTHTPRQEQNLRSNQKKKAGGGPAPTCASLGLDCSETCCAQSGSECAETKLDCAVPFKRPFTELYIGFGTILGITIGVSVFICIMNFCANQASMNFLL